MTYGKLGPDSGYYKTCADEEALLIEHIKALQREYEAAAKPFVDRLVALRSLRPMPPMLVTYEQAQALGIEVKKP